MSDDDKSQRMQLAIQFLQRDVQNLMARGTELEIELALKQAEIERLTAATKPTRKARK